MGVKLRIIAPIIKDNEYFAAWFNRIGEIRHIDTNPIRFVIVDGNEVMLHSSTDDNEIKEGNEIGVYTKNEIIITLLSLI